MARSVVAADVRKIVIACEAGMGSSLMAANKLKQMLKKAGLDVSVAHCPVRSIPQDAQIVLCHEGLSAMAGAMAPWAVSFSFKHFIDIPAFDKIVSALKSGADIVAEE
jgi:mannitol-specific phosphotransferase system IIBC component